MAFTWFDKFDDAIERIPDKKDQDTLILGLVRYGSTGEEPDLPYPLDALFAGFKEDIDHSLKSRENGAKGGSKGAKKPPEKTPQKGGSKGAKKPPEKATSEDHSEGEGSSQYNTVQDNTVQNSTKEHMSSAQALSDSFDVFWSAWSDKRGKSEAKKAYEKALKSGADPTVIIEAARLYDAWFAQTGQGKAFRPHASTWLNQQRWEDDLPDPSSYRSRIDAAPHFFGASTDEAWMPGEVSACSS